MAGEEESAPSELEPPGAAEVAELTGMEPIRETTGSAGGGEDLVHKARGLMRRIVAGRAAPSACLLHSLAGILEHEESRYGSSCWMCAGLGFFVLEIGGGRREW